MWLHGLGDLLATVAHNDFVSHVPQVFTVIENLRVGHVVERVNLSLHFQKQLGIAHVLAEACGHLFSGFEQSGEETTISPENWIFTVEDIESRASIVSIDDYLYAVAHVVDQAVAEMVMGGVRITVRCRERVHDPRQPPVFSNNDVRVLVKGEKRGQSRYAP